MSDFINLSDWPEVTHPYGYRPSPRTATEVSLPLKQLSFISTAFLNFMFYA